MIQPIIANKYATFRKNNQVIKPQNSGISFGERPEYDRLEKNYEVRTSSYFRRGQCYGSPCNEFIDVVRAIETVLKQEAKPKILIVGVGESQEPFSILSVIDSLSKGKKLEDVVDLNCVDLQPKIPDIYLLEQSFLATSREPRFAFDSFEKVEKAPSNKMGSQYKVKTHIFEFLKSVYNNPQKTKWDTLIEEFSSDCPANTYNMISINNTLGYITNNKACKKTMENLANMLKKDGILITDIYDKGYKKEFPCLQKFKNLAPGIWQKTE